MIPKPVVGGIYSIDILEDYSICKVVHVAKDYFCILLFDGNFKTRPKKVDLRKLRKLTPAHATGWMIGAYKFRRFKKWKPELIRVANISKRDLTYFRSWRHFGGIKITPPT